MNNNILTINDLRSLYGSDIDGLDAATIDNLLSEDMILNSYGVALRVDASAALMDDDLREELHDTITPCTEKEFFDAYCAAHRERFGEDFVLDSANPTF